MLDLLKFVLERLMSWPGVVLTLGIIFNKPIRGLMMRLVSFKGAGIEVTTPLESASKQLEAGKEPQASLLAIQTSNQLELPLEEELRQAREAVSGVGLNNEAIGLSAIEIENQLTLLRFHLDSPETSRILIRHVAFCLLEAQSERLFRLIFGSQVNLLHALNDLGPQSAESVQRLYEVAQVHEPIFYAGYSFEEWLGFLLLQKAVVFGDGKYGLSYFGQEFLVWLVRSRAGSKLH